MQRIVDLLLQYGYVALFLNVFAEQVGIPVPAVPILVAMGMLAGMGQLSVLTCVVVASVAAVLGDLIWYALGRTHGHSILNLVCRLSLEPDSCVSNTKLQWNRFGGFTLIFAKFVPGLSTVSPPLAGLTHMRVGHFLVLDLIGTALWVSAYLGVGFLFHNQMERAVELVRHLGSSLTFLVSILLASYIGWKYYNRRRFIQQLRVARVSPEQLMNMIDSGEDVAIVDLRNALELESDGRVLPSAIWIDPATLEIQESTIPRDKEVVLYCS